MFNQERINVLNLLSGQIVISIHNARVYSAFERFVPKEFLKLLGKEDILDVEIGDHIQKNMTILFLDIRNFTTLSETMTPQESFDFINAFLSRIEPLITSHNGFIDKYMGDGIMALFPISVDSALQAAIHILYSVEKYNTLLIENKKTVFRISVGIGINSGLLMLGTIGGEHRMDGTVISDAVNIASRVENLTKFYKVPLLITQNTYSRLESVTKFNIRKIDNVLVKGKKKLVAIYEVFDADPASIKDLKCETANDFEQGIAFYYQDKFSDALPIFEGILKINENDFPAEIYYQRCLEKCMLTPKIQMIYP